MKTLSSRIVLSTALLVGTVATGITLASPDNNNATRPDREAIKTAIESGNYAEFVSLTEERKIAENITIDNFGKLQELHTARENGDTETVKALASELGIEKIGRGKKEGKGERGGAMKEVFKSLTDEQKEELKTLRENGEKDQIIPTLQSWGVEIPAEILEKQAERQSISSAIENGDYTEFTTLTAGKPFAETITEENFSRFQELHAAKEAGDHETVKLITEELGLEKKGKGKGANQKGECPQRIEVIEN